MTIKTIKKINYHLSYKSWFCRLWVEDKKQNIYFAILVLVVFCVLRGRVCPPPSPAITQTCPCNILQYFTTVKVVIFRWKNAIFSDEKMSYFSYFCSKHRSWVHVRTASLRRNPQLYYIKVGCKGVFITPDMLSWWPATFNYHAHCACHLTFAREKFKNFIGKVCTKSRFGRLSSYQSQSK